jgi:hypothetical protein
MARQSTVIRLSAPGLVPGLRRVELCLRVGEPPDAGGRVNSYGEEVRMTSKKVEVADRRPCAFLNRRCGFVTSPDRWNARLRGV